MKMREANHIKEAMRLNSLEEISPDACGNRPEQRLCSRHREHAHVASRGHVAQKAGSNRGLYKLHYVKKKVKT